MPFLPYLSSQSLSPSLTPTCSQRHEYTPFFYYTVSLYRMYTLFKFILSPPLPLSLSLSLSLYPSLPLPTYLCVLFLKCKRCVLKFFFYLLHRGIPHADYFMKLSIISWTLSSMQFRIPSWQWIILFVHLLRCSPASYHASQTIFFIRHFALNKKSCHLLAKTEHLMNE